MTAVLSVVQAHIVELGAVFGRLGELVADHQELTERLHENVSPHLLCAKITLIAYESHYPSISLSISLSLSLSRFASYLSDNDDC